MKSIDDLMKIRDLKVLNKIRGNQGLKESIRLLCIYGNFGADVLFVTTDNIVYGLGSNRYGCLGLSTWDKNISEPRVNETLSGKPLANLYYGFGHCIALTTDGQCYSWGENDFGQLGIGSFDSTHTPTLIRGLPKVVAISCGNRHTLALTSDGQVYGWGRNTFGQVGDGSWCWRWFPVKVLIEDKVRSISCGKCHSLALTRKGLVYVWGLNDFGQLGRHRDEDLIEGKERAFVETPILFPGFESKCQKALCGPNHILLLTAEGMLYSCGLNDKGQVGNGSYATQYKATKILPKLRFKDIITTYDNDLSLVVTTDDKQYVWGFTYYYKNISTPLEVTKYNFGYTLYDSYAQYSGNNRTFETIIFEVDTDFNQNKSASIGLGNTVSKDESFEQSFELEVLSIGSTSDVQNQRSDTYSSDEDISGNVFHKHLLQVFDNPSDYDLKFIFIEKTLFSHKTILNIRNKTFWQKCEPLLDRQTKSCIWIKDYSYEAFYAFIQYLYGFEPQINDRNCGQLLVMAKEYEELELKELCVRRLSNSINDRNVCSLFESAVNYGLNDLKSVCIEYSKSNWKSMNKTQEFEELDENIAKQLIAFTFQ